MIFNTWFPEPCRPEISDVEAHTLRQASQIVTTRVSNPMPSRNVYHMVILRLPLKGQTKVYNYRH